MSRLSLQCDEACGSQLRLARRRSVVGRRIEGCCVQGKGWLLHLLQGIIGECLWILVSNFSKSLGDLSTQQTSRSNVFGVWLDNQYV